MGHSEICLRARAWRGTLRVELKQSLDDPGVSPTDSHAAKKRLWPSVSNTRRKRACHASPAASSRLDLGGALTATLGMTTLVYGLSHAATAGWSSSLTVGVLVLAVVLPPVFVGIESTSAHALMPLRAFAARDRAGAYAIMLSLAASMFATFFCITQFVQNILGYSPLKVGVAFLPMTIGIGGTANVMSRLVSKIGTRLPMTVGPRWWHLPGSCCFRSRR